MTPTKKSPPRRRRVLKGTRFQVLCRNACLLQVQYPSEIGITNILEGVGFHVEVINQRGTPVLVVEFSDGGTNVKVSADATKVRGEGVRRATDAVWRFIRDHWSICHGPVRPQRVRRAKSLQVTRITWSP